MKRILLPTDFSDHAQNAMAYATELYKHEECMFYVLNVFKVYGYSTTNIMYPEPGNPAYDAAFNESRKNIKDTVRRLIFAKNPKHSFEGLSKNNFLLDAINHLVEEKGIDMIVMGTKGAKNARGINYGSNAVTVMEKVTACPVLAIPSRAEFMGYREIIFPTSYEVPYKKSEISPLLSMAKEFKPMIRILHIKENEQLTENQIENRRLLEENLDGSKYSFHSLTNIDPAVGISCFTESRNADLIALVNRKHGFLYRLTEKPVVKGISFYTSTPIMVMHVQNRS
ncbi:universal stress protein [Sinomicrobium weinanense]|uniref:Universal stress protein n=1 Tax=Sinomicrobium weinanense TaxID=2842200 RepID=A0A926JR28_9FLAO|nr:universal stress protein [Sinomicrobium weinanense]MBC9795811.1 universal stress protein [Sinomicrobium weinanense]MBU3121855.1 universal stress protein [Sinomicrobium weinanense]